MIFIDANRADEEPSRLERLDILRRILMYHKTYFEEQPAHVIGLYDHKGMLAVNWSLEPDQEQQGLVRDFWEEVFFEPLIDHFVGKRQLTDTCGWGESPFP